MLSDSRGLIVERRVIELLVTSFFTSICLPTDFAPSALSSLRYSCAWQLCFVLTLEGARGVTSLGDVLSIATDAKSECWYGVSFVVAKLSYVLPFRPSDALVRLTAPPPDHTGKGTADGASRALRFRALLEGTVAGNGVIGWVE